MYNPYDAIKNSVHIRLCGGLAKGAVYTILFAWYEAGCPELHANTNYQQIAGLSNKNWADNQDRIMATVHEIMPNLLKIHKDKSKALQSRQRAAELARQSTRRARAKQSAFADKETGSMEIQPINFSEKKWNEKRSDQVEVERVKQAKKQPKNPNDLATFTD